MNFRSIESGTQHPPLQTSNEEITQVAFRHTDKNILYAASTEGVVTIYDISQEDEDEAFIDGLYMNLGA